MGEPFSPTMHMNQVIELAEFVGDLFACHRRRSRRLFMVVEGLDGSGKTTVVRNLVKRAPQGGDAGRLYPLRLNQYSALPFALRPGYKRLILNLVDAAHQFEEFTHLITEIALQDALLYRIRWNVFLRQIDDHRIPVSDSWCYRRFMRMASLLHFRCHAGDIGRSSRAIRTLFGFYEDVLVATDGILIHATIAQTLAAKAQVYSPWEVVSFLPELADAPRHVRFAKNAEILQALLATTAKALDWRMVERDDPFPSDPGSLTPLLAAEGVLMRMALAFPHAAASSDTAVSFSSEQSERHALPALQRPLNGGA